MRRWHRVCTSWSEEPFSEELDEILPAARDLAGRWIGVERLEDGASRLVRLTEAELVARAFEPRLTTRRGRKGSVDANGTAYLRSVALRARACARSSADQ